MTLSLVSWNQVRGSIPVIWEQIVDLTYRPTITDINLQETVCSTRVQGLSQPAVGLRL